MPLHYSGTWEHALLAATAKAANEIAPREVLGRTALQKIIYFLQVSGVPMRYSFDIYHYGPYCDRITRDVELLQADDVLADSSGSSQSSAYRPTGSADELLNLYSDKLSEYKPKIETLVRSLLSLPTKELELTATLDYLYRQLKAGGGEGPWKDKVINRFLEVKKDKFKKEQVSKTYNTMAEAGIFDPV